MPQIRIEIIVSDIEKLAGEKGEFDIVINSDGQPGLLEGLRPGNPITIRAPRGIGAGTLIARKGRVQLPQETMTAEVEPMDSNLEGC